jgi:hypothetical protein
LTNPLICTLHHIVRLFVNYVLALKLLVCKCNVLPELSSVPFHEGISNGGGCSSILTCDQRWRWVVKFTPPPLYPRGRATSTKLIGSFVDPSVGLEFRNTENLLRLQGTRRFLGVPVRSIVSVPPELSRLSVRARVYVNMQNGSFDCSNVGVY